MKNVLYYLGSLDTVNGQTDPYYIANLINQHDTVILRLPYAQSGLGVISASGSLDYLNLLRIANKPIWVAIDLLPNAYIINAGRALLSAQNVMDYFQALFLTHRMSPLLAGFHFVNFGFGSTAYADSGRLSRAQQNEIVSVAHVKHRLPVSVSAPYLGDLFAAVGPAMRSPVVDQGAPLWVSALGRNPILRDQVMAINPLYADSNGAANFAQMSDALSTSKMLRGAGKNVEILVCQSFNTTITTDAVIGLDLTAWGVNIVNRCQFLANLGFDKVALGSKGFGRVNNQMVDPAACRIETGWQASVYGEFYSRGGTLFTETPVIVDGAPKTRIRTFDTALVPVDTTDVDEG